MKFVILLPFAAVRNVHEWCEGGRISDWAVAAESAGFDAVAVTDHPFPSDAWMGTGGHHAFDPFVILTAFGSVTSRIRLMTDILVAGYRNPYMLAKSIASTDVLSEGRLTVGIAAGYQKAEFEALGASFHDRGRRMDDAIEAMSAALTGESVKRVGGYFPAGGNTMLPTPVQRPKPPIWIGGNADAALKRAVNLADGWMPFHQSRSRVAISRAPSLESLSELKDRIDEATELRAAMGSPPLDFCTSVFETRLGAQGIVERAPEYAAAGVTWIRVILAGPTMRESIRQMEEFSAARAAASD
jgi:probable F420-dependent oxidoreductase